MNVISEFRRAVSLSEAMMGTQNAAVSLRHAANVLDGKPVVGMPNASTSDWMAKATDQLEFAKPAVQEFSTLAPHVERKPIHLHHDAEVAINRAQRLLDRGDTRPDFVQGSVKELNAAAAKLDTLGAQLEGAGMIAVDRSITTRHLVWGGTALAAGVAGTAYVATR